MSQSVELSTLNLRYEGYRLRDEAREARLLASLAARGIEEPLQGVDTPSGRFLLNGFKRYRCARKLGIHSVPYESLGEEEAAGIVRLMRTSRDQALGILEQARFVVDLLTLHDLSLSEVAELLSRSKAWVSMRRGLLEEMGESIQRILFTGAFPVYSYMYTLRPFRRMNSVTRREQERFVESLAGKNLSVREIGCLADGYFRGPPALREAIEAGKLSWTLEQMRGVPTDGEGANEFERVLLKDLETMDRLMRRMLAKSQSPRLQSRAFFAQAHLLTGSLLTHCETFEERLRVFHDRCGRE